MVAFHITDGAKAFLFPAPRYKISLDVFLITGQCNPEIKNIAQKDQVMVSSCKGREHLEKGCVISLGLANVGIGNDNHDIC